MSAPDDSLRADEVKAINDADRFPIIPRVIRMQEEDIDHDENDLPDYMIPHIIMACMICAGAIESVIGEYSLPPL